MDDGSKNHPDPKRTPKRKHPQQQQTHNVPTDDVENTNGTNKGGFANKLQTVPKEQKGCHKWTRATEELQYIDKYILKESKTKESLAEVKIQRGIFLGDALSPLQFVIAMMPLI